MRETISSQALDRAVVVTNAPISSSSTLFELFEEDEQDLCEAHVQSSYENPCKLQGWGDRAEEGVLISKTKALSKAG